MAKHVLTKEEVNESSICEHAAVGATANAKRLHPRDEQGKGAQVQQFVREQQARGHIRFATPYQLW